MADNVPSSPVGHHAKPPNANGAAKLPDNKKIWIGAGVFVLLGILFVAVRSANKNSSAQQGANTTPSGIDPSTGYLYGSAADVSALGGGGAMGSGSTQPPVNITVNPPAGSTGSTGGGQVMTPGGGNTGGPPKGNPSTQPPHKKPSSYYTVKPGDTLWGIAESHGLGSNWQRIYNVSHNHSVIGGNPNLIHPGQRLFIP